MLEMGSATTNTKIAAVIITTQNRMIVSKNNSKNNNKNNNKNRQ